MTCGDTVCKNCPIKNECDEIDDLCGYDRVDCYDILAKIYTKGREDVIDEVIKSLKEVNYEYDENMSIDNNIGSAMLGEFAKGYNKGVIEVSKERAKVLKAVIDCGWHCEVHSDKMLFEMVEEQLKAGEQNDE